MPDPRECDIMETLIDRLIEVAEEHSSLLQMSSNMTTEASPDISVELRRARRDADSHLSRLYDTKERIIMRCKFITYLPAVE